ncbi:MAG TPA: DinB family protein [Flavobacterium sp.]|nr:DinB family protein [Flavobacterium sp.]
MRSTELPNDEYAAYYSTYIAAVGDVDLLEELEISTHDFIRFVQEIPLGKHDYRYAEGKWTIKDIIQHLIDAERIFSYRALRFARADRTPLQSFEENDYVDNANANNRNLQELLTEFATVRQATLMLFKSFDEEQLKRKGIASNAEVTVRAIGFIIIGHLKHHQRVFRERYL